MINPADGHLTTLTFSVYSETLVSGLCFILSFKCFECVKISYVFQTKTLRYSPSTTVVRRFDCNLRKLSLSFFVLLQLAISCIFVGKG